MNGGRQGASGPGGPIDPSVPTAPGPLERTLSRVLLIGVLVSVGLVGLGLLLLWGRQDSLFSSATLEGLRSYPGSFHDESLGQTLRGALALRPAALVYAGLLVLLATPLARVLVAGVLFVRLREWVFVGVATAVGGILLAAWLGVG